MSKYETCTTMNLITGKVEQVSPYKPCKVCHDEEPLCGQCQREAKVQAYIDRMEERRKL